MRMRLKMRAADAPFWILIGLCAAAIVCCAAYIGYHYWYLPRKIEDQNAAYAALYAPEETSAAPSATAPAPSPAPTDVPPTSAPEAVIYAAPTPPPAREQFAALLDINPETVGFLTIEGMLELPVAQRLNDNEYYLAHDFEGEKSIAGSLFLDGVNRLNLDDDCMIVYGHNMKNGTMFGKLADYALRGVLAKYPIVHFDTLYEDGAYVPFACFALDVDADSIALRKFQFDGTQFDDYVADLRARSLYDIPVDVSQGDDLLLLITCNYNVDDGRFVLALRRLREGEVEADLRALVAQSEMK